MLVLHGFWTAHDGLCLWAEDSELPVASTSHALRSARPHPFAAPASVLTALHAGKPAEADLLLPSLRMAPLDSPELIRTTPRPAARSEPALLPWTVPIVMLYAAPALAAVPERAPGVRFGADPGELSALARALAPWEDIGTGKTGPARATFRLAEVTAEPDDVLFGAAEPGVPEHEPADGMSGGRDAGRVLAAGAGGGP